MTRATAAFLVFAFAALPCQAGQGAEPSGTATGRWVVTAQVFGTTRYMTLQLEQHDARVSGAWTGDAIEGTLNGNRLHFVAKAPGGVTTVVDGTIDGGAMNGEAVQTAPGDPTPLRFRFDAALVRPIRRGAPTRHEFAPTIFYRAFSPANPPTLRIAPGDTVHTTTVDAGGTDEKGVKRSAGGNPQTGPFYVEGAMPGDTLVVHLTRLRLNRDWAGSDDAVVESALNSRLAVTARDNRRSIQWRLDVARGLASPANPDPHLGGFTVPVRPMLGCIATATGPAGAPPSTTDSGAWGGNLDYPGLVEGTTVYLPVNNPGALLYLGDGHALQGDGEINGNALETSMDVEFTVDVIQGRRVPFVRLETPDRIVAMGYEGSLDDAFRSATANMADWLASEYRLTASEIAQVIGTTAEYRVSEVADRNSGIVLAIDKARLRTLAPER